MLYIIKTIFHTDDLPYLKKMNDQIIALDDVNISTKGIREQVAVSKKVAERLVSETLFEVEGFKRIQAIPLAFKAFRFDPDSVSLEYEEVELPISIGNKHIMGGPSLPSTFLVSLQHHFYLYY